MPLRHGLAEALDGVGRAPLRPRVRSRHLQHRRRLRFQLRRDGEQGPQHLQRQAGVRQARDRDRRRLRRDRGRHRARVFPQLDGQPHHLPRLVPALPQGRAHGLSRPGVLDGRAQPRREPHRGCAHAAQRRSSPRTAAPSPIRRGPTSTARSTTSTRRPSTRRAPRSCACWRRFSARPASARAWTSTSSATTASATTIEAFLECFADANGVDLEQFKTWYLQAGTPEVTVADCYDEATKTYTLTLSQETKPTPNQPTKSPLVVPVKFGLIGPNGIADDLEQRHRRRRCATTSSSSTRPDGRR